MSEVRASRPYEAHVIQVMYRGGQIDHAQGFYRPISNSDSAKRQTLAKRVVGLGFIVQSVAFYCSTLPFLANTATPTGQPPSWELLGSTTPVHDQSALRNTHLNSEPSQVTRKLRLPMASLCRRSSSLLHGLTSWSSLRPTFSKYPHRLPHSRQISLLSKVKRVFKTPESEMLEKISAVPFYELFKPPPPIQLNWLFLFLDAVFTFVLLRIRVSSIHRSITCVSPQRCGCHSGLAVLDVRGPSRRGRRTSQTRTSTCQPTARPGMLPHWHRIRCRTTAFQR